MQNRYFRVSVTDNRLGAARLGMTVPKRIVKRAVARNRIKRIIRESFRAHRASLPPMDVVVGIRRAVGEGPDRKQLRESLDELWRRLEQRSCAPS